MVGFNSDLENVPSDGDNGQLPNMSGWSLAEVEKFFELLEEEEIARIVRERSEYPSVPLADVAAQFGINLAEITGDPVDSRPVGFAPNPKEDGVIDV